MREIKFRGYDTRDGVREMVTFTLDELLAGTDEYELVDPDSVAQFIGYDADGAEVYEGDTVRHFTGELVKVRLSGETDTYSYLGVAGEKFDDCRLEKE